MKSEDKANASVLHNDSALSAKYSPEYQTCVKKTPKLPLS